MSVLNEAVLETAKRIATEHGFTDASDDDLGSVIWNHTGYPEFWHPTDGATPQECFETQLRRFFAAVVE